MKVNANALRNMVLNAALVELDSKVQEYTDDPAMQMGVLMLAQIKAFRRVLSANNVSNRGKRHKLVSLATKDFESKLRLYGNPDADMPEGKE